MDARVQIPFPAPISLIDFYSIVVQALVIPVSIEFNLNPVDSKGGSGRKRVSKRKGRSVKKAVQRKLNSNNHREELGSWLWGAADILRGAVRAEDYQDFLFFGNNSVRFY